LRNIPKFLKHGTENLNEIEMVAPTGFEPVFQRGEAFDACADPEPGERRFSVSVASASPTTASVAMDIIEKHPRRGQDSNLGGQDSSLRPSDVRNRAQRRPKMSRQISGKRQQGRERTVPAL
jgi:hypothetical protein